MCDDVPEGLDRAPVRCILSERNMRTPPIIIGGEFRKNPPKVFFIEHDQMIGIWTDRRQERKWSNGAQLAPLIVIRLGNEAQYISK